MIWIAVVTTLLRFSCVLGDGAGHDWDYQTSLNHLTPDQWYKNYPHCGGHRQSPIDIVDSGIGKDSSLHPLRFINYGQELSGLIMQNNGHTLQITVPKTYNLTVASASLPATYRLTQFHFHWSSEHWINGIQYPLELHLVHANTRLTDEESLTNPTGLVVVSVMFDYTRTGGPKPSSTMQNLVSHMKATYKEGRNATIKQAVILEELLPCDKTSYVRYSGSLTTPPCAEVIEFHVLTNTVPISHVDINHFHNIRHELLVAKTGPFETSIHNDRPLQKLNSRSLKLHGSLGAFPTDL